MDSIFSMRCKIAYIIDDFIGPVAGTEKQLLSLIKGILERGFEPVLILLRRNHATDTRDIPCPVHCLDLPRIASLKALQKGVKLSALLAQEKVDIANLYFPDTLSYAPLFCKSVSVPVVASIRDTGFRLTRKHRFLMSVNRRFTDRYIANSWAVKNHIIDSGICPVHEKIEVVYNGHDVSGFNNTAPAGIRKKLGLSREDPLVGMVANFNPWKRHRDLLKAFALVRKQVANTHLVLVGDGPLEIELRAKTEELGLSGSVHFLGQVKDAIPYVKDFTVGVLCSETEGLSNTIIEYMGCGKSVVATDVGGNQELVRADENGLTVRAGDIQALASQIVRLIRNEALRKRFEIQARRFVEEAFTFDRMCDHHVEIYKGLLVKEKPASKG